MKKCKKCANCLIRTTENLDDQGVVENYFCRFLGQDPSYLLEHNQAWNHSGSEMVCVLKKALGPIVGCSHFELRENK